MKRHFIIPKFLSNLLKIFQERQNKVNILRNYEDHCIDRFITDVENNSVCVFISDTISPYKEYKIVCQGVIVFSFFRTEEDKAPYFCPEFYWQRCNHGELKILLDELKYPFYNCADTSFKGNFLGDVITPGGDRIHLHFDGHAYGDVICESVIEKEMGVK